MARRSRPWPVGLDHGSWVLTMARSDMEHGPLRSGEDAREGSRNAHRRGPKGNRSGSPRCRGHSRTIRRKPAKPIQNQPRTGCQPVKPAGAAQQPAPNRRKAVRRHPETGPPEPRPAGRRRTWRRRNEISFGAMVKRRRPWSTPWSIRGEPWSIRQARPWRRAPVALRGSIRWAPAGIRRIRRTPDSPAGPASRESDGASGAARGQEETGGEVPLIVQRSALQVPDPSAAS